MVANSCWNVHPCVGANLLALLLLAVVMFAPGPLRGFGLGVNK